MENKFKTIHENKLFWLPEKQPTLIEVLNNLKSYILSLSKYKCNSNSGGQDCWCTMDEDKEGEYIKLEDVLKLFVVENE